LDPDVLGEIYRGYGLVQQARVEVIYERCSRVNVEFLVRLP
jgi:hypothetical protein